MEEDILLTRWILSKKSSIGVVSFGGVFVCNSIEDADRALVETMTVADILKRKLYGVTAIPYGRYEVRILKSPRLSIKKGKDVSVPYLMEVPGYSGIEIHPANFASELRGCIGPGIYDDTRPDSVWFSKQSYAKLFSIIEDQLRERKLYIRIEKSKTPIQR